MPTDTASSGVTATTAVRIPVLTSGAEAIRAARNLAAFLADGAIERDRSGALSVRELPALDARGQRATKVHAARALLATEAAVLDEVTRTPENAAAAARASLAIAPAQADGSEV